MIDVDSFVAEFEGSDVPGKVRNDGYFIFQQKLSSETCDDLRCRIDDLAQAKDVEVNYKGSEHRVWHAHKKDNNFAAFERLSNAVMPILYGRPSSAHNVLAIRNRPRPVGSERENTRWHLDSFRRQLKLFVFLSDVTEETGPFQLVEGTHKPLFKWSQAIPLGYYGLSDLRPGRGKARKWQYLDDETIAGVVASGKNCKTFNVTEGTVALVDTSAIHRAKPCEVGERYAISTYHR